VDETDNEGREHQIREDLKEKFEVKYQILLDENGSLKLRVTKLDKR